MRLGGRWRRRHAALQAVDRLLLAARCQQRAPEILMGLRECRRQRQGSAIAGRCAFQVAGCHLDVAEIEVKLVGTAVQRQSLPNDRSRPVEQPLLGQGTAQHAVRRFEVGLELQEALEARDRRGPVRLVHLGGGQDVQGIHRIGVEHAWPAARAGALPRGVAAR